MPPRYRIRFTGPVVPGMVQWLQALIPVLRQAPKDVRITVEIDHDDQPQDGEPRARPHDPG